MGGKNSPESINRYIAKAYDRINLTVPKGKKDTIKAHAESHGQSVNSFINEAIDEKMERDGTPGGLEKSASPPTSPLRVVAKIPKRF